MRAPRTALARIRFNHLMWSLLGWYHQYDLPAGSHIRKHWAKMSELLEHKPTYYVTHSYRNAVWGFEWEGEKFILYKDQRGLALQVTDNFPATKAIPLVKLLLKKLKYGKISGPAEVRHVRNL